MKVFKTWQLLNREWRTAALDPDFQSKYNGMCKYDRALVFLNPEMDEYQDLREHKWLHEMVHVVAGSLGLGDINDDEYMVDAIAAAVHQILQTGRGDYYGSVQGDD